MCWRCTPNENCNEDVRAVDATIEAAAQDGLHRWPVSRRALLRAGLGLLAWPASSGSSCPTAAPRRARPTTSASCSWPRPATTRGNRWRCGSGWRGRRERPGGGRNSSRPIRTRNRGSQTFRAGSRRPGRTTRIPPSPCRPLNKNPRSQRATDDRSVVVFGLRQSRISPVSGEFESRMGSRAGLESGHLAWEALFRERSFLILLCHKRSGREPFAPQAGQ